MAALDLWIKDPSNPIGQRPTIGNCDGHDSNINNLEFTVALMAANVYMVCPPSQTTSTTQQCDQPKAKGGPIACQKPNFENRVMMHLRNKQVSKQKCTITMAELVGDISYLCLDLRTVSLDSPHRNLQTKEK